MGVQSGEVVGTKITQSNADVCTSGRNSITSRNFLYVHWLL